LGNPSPLQNRELFKRLAPFGVIRLSGRGKGSEAILLKETFPGSRKGPMYTIKWHKDSDTQNPQVIKKILDRFGINAADFWA
jgi:hypothetical protein